MKDEKRSRHLRRQKFLNLLPRLCAEAGRLELFITARALHNVVKAAGWEAAGETAKAATYADSVGDQLDVAAGKEARRNRDVIPNSK